MMRIASLLLLAAVACAGEEATAQAEVVPDDAPQEYVSDSVKLTKDNFGQITSNRTVFIKVSPSYSFILFGAAVHYHLTWHCFFRLSTNLVLRVVVRVLHRHGG